MALDSIEMDTLTRRPDSVLAPMYPKGAEAVGPADPAGPFAHSTPASRTETPGLAPALLLVSTHAGAKAMACSSRGQYMRQPTENPARRRSTWGATRPATTSLAPEDPAPATARGTRAPPGMRDTSSTGVPSSLEVPLEAPMVATEGERVTSGLGTWPNAA